MTNEQKLYIHTDYIWHLNHPITPPPELVMQCLEDSPEDGEFGISKHIATQAARWGADQELDACCEYLTRCAAWEPEDIQEMRDLRRPKPPSLKEQDYGPLGEKQQMTEIEEIKAQLNVLEKKLSFLEELEKTKSPAEEAYRRWWGEYPSDDNGWEIDNTRWRGFRVGYNYAQKDYKVGEWEPTPQTPEQVADGLKEAFREAVKQGVVSSSTKKQTLYELIADWWDEVFCCNPAPLDRDGE